MPCVSFFVHDLHSNPIVRAAPIAFALQRLGFRVEMLGMMPPGKQLYAPYADAFEYHVEVTTGRVIEHARRLAKRATGDVLYACKPFKTTLLPAMLASHAGYGRPALLDVEDDDIHVCEAGFMQRVGRSVREFSTNPLSLSSVAVHQMRRRCVHTTVSSTAIQNFYGGTLLLHGPDENSFDPADRLKESSVSVARDCFGLPVDKQLVLFAGGPGHHKGFDLIVQSVLQAGDDLVLAGNPDNAEFVAAKESLGSRCHLLGLVSNHDMPKLLKAIDVVPVPQRDVAYARAQLPAKLIEAMAMAKSVIVSDIGDLPKIVGHDNPDLRGWVVPADNVDALTGVLGEIRSNPDERLRRERSAREYFLKHASVTANSEILRDIFLNSPKLRRFVAA